MLTLEFIEDTVPQRFSRSGPRHPESAPESPEIWSLYEGSDEYLQPTTWLCLGNYRLIKTIQIPRWVVNFYTNEQPAASALGQRFIKNLFYSEMRTVLVSYAELNQGISSEV